MKEREEERKRLQQQKDEDRIQARYKATAQWTLEKLVGVITELYPKVWNTNGDESELYKKQHALTQTQMKSIYNELKVLEECAREYVAGRTKALEFGKDEVNKALASAKVLLRNLSP